MLYSCTHVAPLGVKGLRGRPRGCAPTGPFSLDTNRVSTTLLLNYTRSRLITASAVIEVNMTGGDSGEEHVVIKTTKVIEKASTTGKSCSL